MICFPHAGGSASYYLPLSKGLAPHAEVLVLQYPGRQDRGREPFVDNIPDLADQVFNALLPVSGRPFAFFGHSMGAVVAYEVARRFHEHTETGPAMLFPSGRRAPSCYRPGDIHLRDDAGIVAELHNVGGTASRALADPDVLEMILPAVRNDYHAIETYLYSPGPLLPTPVTVLVGSSDPQTSIDDAAAWREHTTGEFNLRVFPGGHFYLEACQSDVIDTIRAAVQTVIRTSAETEVPCEI